MGLAGSITQVRVGMAREGDWDGDTNFDKVSDDVFWFPLKKKKIEKMGMEVQGRGGRRNTRATLMSFCCSVMYANPLLLPNSSNTRDAST
jgi:hypothetical protein